MIGKLTLLSLLALAQGKPYDALTRDLSVHDLCPKDQTHSLLPHEYDCTLFYYCEYGFRYEEPRSCAPGTEFSAEKQVCIHPAVANCNLPGIPPTDGIENGSQNKDNEHEIPDQVESEEQKHEFEEVNPFPVEPQPESEEQKPEVEEEVPVESEEQKPEVEEETPLPENPQPESEEQKPEVEEETSEAENPNPEPPKDLLPNGCPADIHEHWLLPHESECNKFYYCNFGKKVVTTCAPGTYFDYEMQVCIHTADANCNLPGLPPTEEIDQGEDNEPEVPEKVESEEQKPDVEEVNPVPVEPQPESDEQKPEVEEETPEAENQNHEPPKDLLPNGCPADFHEHWLLPHESECNKFYYCNYGEKIVITCALGTYFNHETQMCDWPENVKCGNGGNDENSEENNNNNGDGNDNSLEDNGNNGENNGNSEENNNSNDVNNINSGEDNGENNGNSEENNNNTSVDNGDSEEGDGNGVDFEEVPDNVNSGQENGENNDNSEENNNNNGVDNGTGEEDNGNNGENHGNGEEDNENDVENEEVPDDSKCANTCNTKPWAHAYHCDKFWRCDDETATLVVCSEGLFFNSNTGTCDFKCNVNCISEYVEKTANAEGLKIFIPWNKVDYNTKKSYTML